MQAKLTPQGVPNWKLGFPTREGTRVFLPYAQNFESVPSVRSVGSYPQPKIESSSFPSVSLRPSIDHRPHVGKKLSLIAFRQIIPKISNWSLVWRKTYLEWNPLVQNTVQQDYLPELYYSHPASPLSPKLYLLL